MASFNNIKAHSYKRDRGERKGKEMRGEERRREGRGGEERDKRPKSLEKNEQY
jgi:hypothetical protein